MIIAGIVVAAGRGERFGGAKQLAEIGGMPLWKIARDLLRDAGADPVVVVGPVPGGIPGGIRRRDSVAAGLAQVPVGADWVLVHDAVRPLAGPDLVGRVVERLIRGDADGVVPVVAVRDTLKRVRGDRIVETLDRRGLATAQTPQGFRTDALREAHATVGGDATDDAALVERNGGVVATVPGDSGNLKITYPEDLLIAEALR